MSPPLYLTLKAYLENVKFKVRLGNAIVPLSDIVARVPLGSDISPDLSNNSTADIAKTDNILLATFAHDPAILSTNKIYIDKVVKHLNFVDS